MRSIRSGSSCGSNVMLGTEPCGIVCDRWSHVLVPSARVMVSGAHYTYLCKNGIGPWSIQNFDG